MSALNETPPRRTGLRSGLRKRSHFKSNKRLKAEARASLIGNLARPVFCVFLYMLSNAVLAELIANYHSDSVPVSLLFSVIIFLVLGTCAKMLRIGLSCIFLRLHFRKDVKISDLFYAFGGRSDTAVICCAYLSLAELIFVFPLMVALSLGSYENRTAYAVLLIALSLLGFAGLIFVRIRYALCPYLLLDFPGLPAGTMIRGSAKMLRGHQMRLFKLYLSLLPMYGLSVLSFGVAGLWVTCYSHAAEAAFYRDLAEKI